MKPKSKFYAMLLTISGILHYSIGISQSLSSGVDHTLFLCQDQTVVSVGRNQYGQLGTGNNNNVNPVPAPVAGLNGIIALSAGGNYSIFLKNDGTVWGCGINANGQLGDGSNTDTNTPVQVTPAWGSGSIIAVAAHSSHTLLLKNDGTVWACGDNSAGQLGDGTTTNTNVPVQVSPAWGAGSIIAVAAGGGHSLFLKNDSTVWVCGSNFYGQLGQGTSDWNPHPIPLQITSLTGITDLSAGNSSSHFLKNDSTVWACGYNGAGGLGDGTTTNKFTPVQVVAGASGCTTWLCGITAISAAFGYSLFLRNDSTVWSCGLNDAGQLGDGTTTNKYSPVQVNITGAVINIDASKSKQSFFEKNDGAVWACGNNSYGKLAKASSASTSTPEHCNYLNCNLYTLPIELLSLTGKCAQNKITLQWQTASEINNDYFTVLRSQNGYDYEEVGIVGGAGNSSTTLQYVFYDERPHSEYSYYRLKQTDFDGSFTFSNIVAVYCNVSAHINIYPNPADNEVQIAIGLPTSQDVVVKVINSIGQTIIRQAQRLDKGKKTFSVDIGILASGLYTFRVTTLAGEYTQKIIIRK